jgi:hypothetical protein
MRGKADRLHRVCMVHSVVTTTTCRQLGNNTTYDTEKKNPTSHDVADTSAMSGRCVGKTRHHVIKTNCGRHLKRRHFQLSSSYWSSSWPPGSRFTGAPSQPVATSAPCSQPIYSSWLGLGRREGVLLLLVPLEALLL